MYKTINIFKGHLNGPPVYDCGGKANIWENWHDGMHIEIRALNQHEACTTQVGFMVACSLEDQLVCDKDGNLPKLTEYVLVDRYSVLTSESISMWA